MLDVNVSKVTIADSVAQQIRDLILSNSLNPGDKLPSQRELAEQLGVGRPAIREALMRLDSMGLIRVRHGQNTIVQRADLDSLIGTLSPVLEITETDVLPLLETKEIIETKCAELAAGRISEVELAEMKNHLAEMEKYRNKPQLYAQADYLFHYVIVTSARNPFINEIMKIVGRMIQKAIEKTVLGSGLIGRDIAMEYHHRIFAALERKNGPEAAKLVKEHLSETMERYSKILDGTLAGNQKPDQVDTKKSDHSGC